MGKQLTTTFRGKGTSTTKFTKAGEPKHAGNWSASSIEHQTLQTRDYPVYVRKNDETGIRILIVGEHTPLSEIMGELVHTLAITDEHFYQYRQEGEFRGLGNGKSYASAYTLTKRRAYTTMIAPHRYVLRLEICTRGDFTYNFPNY